MASLPSGESPTHTILSRVANGNVSHLLLQEKQTKQKNPINWILGCRNNSHFGIKEIQFETYVKVTELT